MPDNDRAHAAEACLAACAPNRRLSLPRRTGSRSSPPDSGLRARPAIPRGRGNSDSNRLRDWIPDPIPPRPSLSRAPSIRPTDSTRSAQRASLPIAPARLSGSRWFAASAWRCAENHLPATRTSCACAGTPPEFRWHALPPVQDQPSHRAGSAPRTALHSRLAAVR